MTPEAADKCRGFAAAMVARYRAGGAFKCDMDKDGIRLRDEHVALIRSEMEAEGLCFARSGKMIAIYSAEEVLAWLEESP